MSVPLTQEEIQTAVGIGAGVMVRCAIMQLPERDADIVTVVGLATAQTLYGVNGYTDAQLGVCIMAAKAGYLLGNEQRTMFAGFG